MDFRFRPTSCEEIVGVECFSPRIHRLPRFYAVGIFL
jgi:hypothetical protein